MIQLNILENKVIGLISIILAIIISIQIAKLPFLEKNNLSFICKTTLLFPFIYIILIGIKEYFGKKKKKRIELLEEKRQEKTNKKLEDIHIKDYGNRTNKLNRQVKEIKNDDDWDKIEPMN